MNMKHYMYFLFTAALFCRPLCGQEKIRTDTIYSVPTVTVSATYAVPRISPVTFSDMNRQQIQERYSVQDIPDILSGMPSVNFYSENGNGIGYNYINLRGFDQRRISVMVNGIPQNDPEDHNVYWIDFPDLLGSTENIQVQRGAGSAFYGPPAIGGSVNILAIPFSRQPSVTLESMFGFQEYGATGSAPLSTHKYSAAFNSGLVGNKYMFYGRIGKLTTDGYRDRAWVDIRSYFFGAARFDETMSTRIHFYGGPFSDGLVYNGLPRFYNKDPMLRRINFNYFELNDAQDTVTYATFRRPQETEQFSQPHFELINEWRLSPKIVLHNTFFYIQGDGYYDYDGSWADTSMLRIGTKYGFPTTANPSNTLIRAFVGNRQAGWLPRVEIGHGKGTLTVGAEIRVHRSVHWGKISYAENLPPDYDPDYRFYEYNGKKDIISFYGHELFNMNEKTTLMADIQLAYNRYSIANEKYLDNSFSVPYFFVNPRIGINLNLNENINIYSSLAYTSREPRLKNLYAAEESFVGATPQFEADTSGGRIRYYFDKPLAKPERLLDYEIGIMLRNKRVCFSLDLFWMEFMNELIKSGRVDIFGQPVTGNADRTRHLGIEMEGELIICQGLAVSGNATVSHNRLVNYSVIENVVDGIVSTRRLDGNPIAGSPDYMANLRLAQSGNDWKVFADAKYVGSFYTDNTKNELLKNDAYTVFNIGGIYTFRTGTDVSIIFRGEIRNLFDNLYTMSGEGYEFFPAAERNYILGISVGF
jgi:iron complex outermembrane receptor protein